MLKMDAKRIKYYSRQNKITVQDAQNIAILNIELNIHIHIYIYIYMHTHTYITLNHTFCSN